MGDSETSVSDRRRSGLHLFRKLLVEQHAFRPHLTALLLLNLLATPLALLAPIGLKIAVDSYVGSAPLPPILRGWVPESITDSSMGVLIFAVGLTVLIAGLMQAQKLGSVLLRNYTTEKMVLGFRVRLFPHVQQLSLSYHDEKGTSDSTYRVLYDTAAIPAILIDGVLPLTSAAFRLLGMFVVVMLLSWPLALIAVTVAPLLLLISRPFAARLRTQWHEVKELDSRALSLLQEVLSSVRVVKAFGREEREKERLIHLATEGMWARIRVAMTQGGFDTTTAMITAIGIASVLFTGMWQVKSGGLTLGEFLVVMAYLTQLYDPMQVIISQMTSLQSAFASAERALHLLEKAPDVEERRNARALERASGNVSFRDVSFSYDSDNVVLRGISFEIPAGTRLGIAGNTGSGKTTLINLLTRLYDPDDGQILLDGVDLRDYRLTDLRRQFAVVLQEPVLFSKSIGENIAYGRPGAHREDILEAARLAGAHDFISRLPDGYDTMVGERGMRVSGGERQRISLARAYLRDSPILILDEPTSSVDIRTEAIILEALERLMENRTVFIIAHRPSTLANCDMVLAIQDGRVARMGRPDSASFIESFMLEGDQ